MNPLHINTKMSTILIQKLLAFEFIKKIIEAVITAYAFIQSSHFPLICLAWLNFPKECSSILKNLLGLQVI